MEARRYISEASVAKLNAAQPQFLPRGELGLEEAAQGNWKEVKDPGNQDGITPLDETQLKFSGSHAVASLLEFHIIRVAAANNFMEKCLRSEGGTLILAAASRSSGVF